MENKPIVNYFETNVNWKECADLGGFFKSTMCSFGKTNDFVKLHLTYPTEARKNKIEGSCQVRAYYDESGKLTKAEIIEDIGYGCGEEALRVVKLMPEMSPALKDGKPTYGVLMLNVTFKLTKEKNVKKENFPYKSSLSNAISDDGVFVRPNPARDFADIIINPCLPEDLTVTITDIQGKMFFQKKYKNDFALF
ncbi:MAG: energy transducer TonB, partial [Saprospiraceae bacterium]|nr:energy transducer TonB [Saprospiraceae bacterium]